MSLVIESLHKSFFNIYVYKKQNNKRVKKEGFIKKLINENEMQQNFYEAYCHYINRKTAISFKT